MTVAVQVVELSEILGIFWKERTERNLICK